MSSYSTFGDIQNELRSYYFKTGERLQFNEALERLASRGCLTEEKPVASFSTPGGPRITDSEFDKIVDSIAVPVTAARLSLTERVSEEDMFPQLGDAFIIRHPRYTRPYLHRHDYVEINYVMNGTCTLYFEEEVLTLNRGSFIVVSPSSTHDVVIDDESSVYTIMLRRSTFQASFFSLLDYDNVLSSFFRTTLTDVHSANYILFEVENIELMNGLIQSAMQECHKTDIYSNSCTINLIHLLFACVLRSKGDSPKIYHYQMTSDFSSVLHYIRHNHRTISLSELADEFHYSKPHMCTLIKQNTGVSFSTLIRQVRLSEASRYLLKTDLSISDIAEMVGYNSADNFSRVFRKAIGVSPKEYRHQHVNDDNKFVPFKME